MSSAFASYREITDANNRVYRVGETDRELLGRSRAWMVWLPWAAMMAISVYEYGYGAAAKSLRDAHHRSGEAARRGSSTVDSLMALSRSSSSSATRCIRTPMCGSSTW
jgi:hypothetical protein